jgi:hypothetical protein
VDVNVDVNVNVNVNVDVNADADAVDGLFHRWIMTTRSLVIALALALALAGCGGNVTVDPGTTTTETPTESTFDTTSDTTAEEGHLAIAIAKDTEAYLILGHAAEGRTCDTPDVPPHCAHWSMTVVLPWELLKVGSTSFEPPVNAHCIKRGGDPGDDLDDCPLTQISGISGQLTVDEITDEVIRGRLDNLGESGLPGGEVAFEAVRCPGDWKL